jgi:spectinomycin phosphotransferase
MLEKPDIPDQLILSRLQEEYGLQHAQLQFLPIGADLGTVVYRAVADDGRTYFLKLRKGFRAITITVPLYLQGQNVEEMLTPLPTRSKGYWADFDEYKMILYPFIEGRNGFERELTDDHRRTLGAVLRQIHQVRLPPELSEQITTESFDPYWRERLRSLQKQAEESVFEDVWATQLAEFMKNKRDEFDRLIGRTEELAATFRHQPLEFVLCHTDVHGGNILIGDDDTFYLVDWDDLLLAPRERDLMFIGGGIDTIWKSERDESVFYEGYGNRDIDLALLAYYRYARVIEDLVAYGEQLFLSSEGGADREIAYRRLTGNFAPGGTIEIAQKTDSSANR